jgi:hypothetical protein
VNTAVYLWVPIAGVNLNLAVPAFNCAFPTTAASSQRGAEASQKVTDPLATGAPPATTEAVNVTAVGEATEGEESTSVVVVGTAAAWAALGKLTAIRADRNSVEFRRRGGRTLAEKCHKFHIQGSSVRTAKLVNAYGTGNAYGRVFRSKAVADLYFELQLAEVLCYWRNESYTKHDPALHNQFGANQRDIGLHADNITHMVPSVLRLKGGTWLCSGGESPGRHFTGCVLIVRIAVG